MKKTNLSVMILGLLSFFCIPAYANHKIDKVEFLHNLTWNAQKDIQGHFILNEKMAISWLPESKVSGKWVQLSAVSLDKTTFKVWLHMFVGDYPLIRPLPTSCKIENNQAVCSSIAWIHPSYAKKVRAAFIANEHPSIISKIQIKTQKGKIRKPELAQFDQLLTQIRKVFFKTKEVNWTQIRHWVLPVFMAPKEVDPLPYAIALVASQLPSNKHIFVYETPLKTPATALQKETENLALPYCYDNESNHQTTVVLPQTFNGNEDLYVKAAHQCLNSVQTQSWVIDLRNNQGGNAAVQLAALAPILGHGIVLNYINPEGEKIPVSINKLGVFNGSNLRYQFDLASFPEHKKENVTVLIGNGCGSSCEAVAISLRSKIGAKLVGSDTAGFATANESIKINDQFSLAITAGYIANAAGQIVYPKVTPDINMPDEEISRTFLIK